MRIFLNTRFLTQPITGVQRFAIELVSALRERTDALTLVAPDRIVHQELAEKWGVHTFGRWGGHAWEQLELPAYLRQQQRPLLINLCNTAPLRYTNQVVTVHDMAFRVAPQWFSKNFARYYNFLIPRITRKSRAVFTVSETSKNDIVRYCQVPNDKVTVVYNAIPQPLHERVATPAEVRAQLPESYILAVGSLDPRKNLRGLIKAFQHLQEPNLNLVIVGGKHRAFNDPEVDALVQNHSAIRWVDYVSGDTLKHYYANARAFVNASLYEGFGLPNLEAMAQHCPVIASDIPVFHEVLGDAVVYTNPNDPEAIATAIRQVLHEPHLASTMREKGDAQSQRYSYARSAETLWKHLQPHLHHA